VSTEGGLFNLTERLIMGEEFNLIVGEMREGFKAVRNDIEISRNERHNQIEQLNRRMNKIMEEGCAHFPQHQQSISDIKVDLATLTTYMIADRTKELDRSEESGLIGSVGYKKLRVTGLAAVMLIVLIGLAIIKWGPTIWTKPQYDGNTVMVDTGNSTRRK